MCLPATPQSPSSRHRKDPILRFALRLRQFFEKSGRAPVPSPQAICEPVLRYTRELECHLDRSQLAHQRGWASAAQVVDRRAVDALETLQIMTFEALDNFRIHQRPPLPEIRDLYEDLIQLQEEFNQVQFQEKQGTISAVTEPITLEEVYLGEFRIELSLFALRDYADIRAFKIDALDPHPSTSKPGICHPHVKDHHLCAGDGTIAISQSLKAGNICNAFLTIRSILQTYNNDSPYVELSDWEGIACADCGGLVRDDGRNYCERCGRDFCDDCYSLCDICKRPFCLGCMETDAVSSHRCCSACQRNCGRCNRLVDLDSFDEETRLCPECHQHHLEEQEADQPETSQPNPLHKEPAHAQ